MRAGPCLSSLNSLIEVNGRQARRTHDSLVKLVASKDIYRMHTSSSDNAKVAFSPTSFAIRRLAREWKTMAAMVRCFCRGRHGGQADLCPQCRQLLDYATTRLQRCRFVADKPTCANCPVHCYQPHRREQMREVMRYAGPQMLWRHPILSLRHWLDGFRKASECHG